MEVWCTKAMHVWTASMRGILHMVSFNYTNGHQCCLLLELTMKMDAQEMAMYKPYT